MSDGIDWILRLSLEPHPEGGFFRRIHTDRRLVETGRGPRAAVTSIHYLLTRGQPCGRLHRNRSDILHYLQHGGPVEYVLFDEAEDCVRRVVLGSGEGQAMFLFVAGGVWKGSRLLDSASHALVAEVVTPGFDYVDHEFAPLRFLETHPEYRDELSLFVKS